MNLKIVRKHSSISAFCGVSNQINRQFNKMENSIQHFLRLPNGLQELMSDISREVMRKQPHDMLHFIASYLDAMLKIRECTRTAVQFSDQILRRATRIYEKLEICRVSMGCSHEVAHAMLEHFREYKAKKEQGCDDEFDSAGFLKRMTSNVSLSSHDQNHLQDLIDAALREYLQRKPIDSEGKSIELLQEEDIISITDGKYEELSDSKENESVRKSFQYREKCTCGEEIQYYEE